MKPGTLLLSIEPYYNVPQNTTVIILSISPTGACKIMASDGRIHTYSSIFLSRNYKVIQ